MTPARVTAIIQLAAQCVRTSVRSTASGRAFAFVSRTSLVVETKARARRPSQRFPPLNIVGRRPGFRRPTRDRHRAPGAERDRAPRQIWSQGEDHDNHYWFPTYDYPNDKMTWDLEATVPAQAKDLVKQARTAAKEVQGQLLNRTNGRTTGAKRKAA